MPLAAPGQDVLTTARGGRYANSSGTSVATAQVSGAAALLAAARPTATPDQIRGALVGGVRRMSRDAGMVGTGGSLDASRAMSRLIPGAGPRVTLASRKLIRSSSGRVALRWRARGAVGAVARYKVKVGRRSFAVRSRPPSARPPSAACCASGRPLPLHRGRLRRLGPRAGHPQGQGQGGQEEAPPRLAARLPPPLSAPTGLRTLRAVASLVQLWRRLGFEQKVAAVAAVLLIVSTFGPFSMVEAAVILTAVGVLALLRARAEGRRFHLPLADGTLIMAAAGWAALLILTRLFDRPLGQNVLALACAALLAAAGLRERAVRPRDDVPPSAPPPDPVVEWESPADDAVTVPLARDEEATAALPPTTSRRPPRGPRPDGPPRPR